ncbi:LysR substrate-binding domain-containing protein [Aurantimonas sp. MSK8Z-1]|uniref:LysR family transcriptional regulator n=1 Tax=Mangrovibrevibacter kandeliae TaxID=2968473 RepID=UPI00211976CE|nr:LysR family transcriptional regulator [Aurantimonas sp. MSK8Z-1]MCW4113387.1 LysR substrate-binding domain-containing protein [Aurantimonas sp. MSK8Z-1]
MTLEQLRVFVAVADRQHVTAAARALNLTQSAASAAIAALEERHDVRLFDRIGRGIVLTEAGRTFLDEARGVLARVVAAEQALDELAGLERGTLRLVASQTIAAYWLPPLLARFHDAHPRLSLEVAIGNTEQAAAAVRDGDAELGFVEGEAEDARLERWRLSEDRLLLVSAPPGPTSVRPNALRAARWVMREQGSGTRSVFNAAMARLGVDPQALDVTLVLPSNEAVRTAVEAGAGLGALSQHVVAPAIAAGTLVALPLDLGSRPFYGLRHRQRFQSRAAASLLALIGESVQAAGGAVT